jgi:hypothetical protein
MQMKQVVLALAAAGVLSSQALAAEGWDAEAPGVQPVQAALAGTEAALPEQVALVALVVQEHAGQMVEYSAKLPAVLPELPAVLAVAEPAPFSAADMQALFVPSTEPLRVAVLSAQEMEETQGAIAFAPFLAWSLASGATSAWIHHGRSFHNTGRLGSARGAAWAAGSGFVGGVHGRGLAAGAGLAGWQGRFMSANGFAVSTALNTANPFARR